MSEEDEFYWWAAKADEAMPQWLREITDKRLVEHDKRVAAVLMQPSPWLKLFTHDQ